MKVADCGQATVTGMNPAYTVKPLLNQTTKPPARLATRIGYGVITGEGEGPGPDADAIQITVFRDRVGNYESAVSETLKAISCCETMGLKYILHPVGYFLSETRLTEREENLRALRFFARNAGEALIIHDETTPWGSRLDGDFAGFYKNALGELSEFCPVFVENACHTPDIKWFWSNFDAGVALDIGHLEAAGLNSEEFVENLGVDILSRIGYVHIHRKNGIHMGGLNDHWGLTGECRELRAFRKLIGSTKDFTAIVEVVYKDEIENSMKLLKETL
ncbi:MAG: hypothetical protein HQK89_08080 [Nitrospirae bacterium]|nr:hypothetical protein [Nitrospirota bacterium]